MNCSNAPSVFNSGGTLPFHALFVMRRFPGLLFRIPRGVFSMVLPTIKRAPIINSAAWFIISRCAQNENIIHRDVIIVRLIKATVFNQNAIDIRAPDLRRLRADSHIYVSAANVLNGKTDSARVIGENWLYVSGGKKGKSAPYDVMRSERVDYVLPIGTGHRD